LLDEGGVNIQYNQHAQAVTIPEIRGAFIITMLEQIQESTLRDSISQPLDLHRFPEKQQLATEAVKPKSSRLER
jgi:hypothetical protein